MPDETPVRKPHELDTIIVCNANLNCNDVDSEENYPHAEYFQVRWSGHPHRIVPGMTKKMPRFLAEHYAKHLANHILLKREEETGRKGLVQSIVERPKVVSQILLGVDSYFLGEVLVDEGTEVAKTVNALNPEEKALDLGEIPNPLMGVLKPEPKPVVYEDEPIVVPEVKIIDTGAGYVAEPVITTSTVEPVVTKVDAKPSIWDESKPKPTKHELLADCEKLGIEVTGKETVDQLISKIKAF